MINFRFHLVSLIAVFLALALGVVVGSTVIDRAIVDGLEAQIDRVERNAESARRENNALRSELQDFERFADQAAALAIEDRLVDVPVTVVAIRGIDDGAAHAVVDALRMAGADAPAILWFEPAWALATEEQRQQVRELLGAPSLAASTARTAVIRRLADRLAVPAPDLEPADGEGQTEDEAGAGTGDDGGSATGSSRRGIATARQVPTTQEPTTTTTAAPDGDEGVGEGEDSDILSVLVDRGFIALDTVAGPDVDVASFPPPGTRVVALDGPGGRVSVETLFFPLVRELVDAEISTLAASVERAADDEDVAETLQPVRENDELAAVVSTVDGVQTERSRVALVVALEQLGEGTVGHYGTGSGATRQLPELREAAEA